MNRARLLCAALAAGALVGCSPQYQQSQPPWFDPVLDSEAIVTADGARLPLLTWLPEGRPKAVIVALHSMNDYSREFAGAAETWRQAGIATYAYDQRGFGGTAQRGVWPGAAPLVRDYQTAVGLVRRRHPGVPVYSLGTSMGGAVILAAAAHGGAPPVDGVILLAPAVWARATMPAYYTASLWLAAHTMPALTLTGRGLNRIASDNRAMLRELARDPMVLKSARVDSIYGMVELMDRAYAAAAALKVPALLLYGANDQIIPRQPVETVARRLPAAALRFAFYERGYHMLLRDLQGRVVQRDIAAWVADRNAPLPSGADARAKALINGGMP